MSGDLPAGDGRDDGERDLALAVRRAVLDDDAWSPERLSALAERADRRASRRRRRRLVVAPVASLAAAAAVALGLVVVPPLVTADRGAVEAAAPSPAVAAPDGDLDPAATAAAEREGRLSAAEVRAVVPGAWAVPGAATGPETGVGQVESVPDACGTGELVVARPVARSSARWQVPTGGDEVFPTSSAAPSVTSQVDTYADAQQAAAAADALDASADTCTPQPGASQPRNPMTFQVYITNAIYGSTTEGEPGVYRVTAAAASGAHVATVSAVLDRVETSEWDIAEQGAAGDVASLAKAAAARADGREDLAALELEPTTPVTTAEVRWLVSGAEPLPDYRAGISLAQEPLDACGTAPLQDVTTAGQVRRGAWSDPALSDPTVPVGGGPLTAMGTAAVVVTASDFGTSAAAQAYAAAFRDSAGTCTPGGGSVRPTVLGDSGTDVLLVAPADATTGRSWSAAVVVRGTTAVTVLALVSYEGDRASHPLASAVASLAATAADRAAASSGDVP